MKARVACKTRMVYEAIIANMPYGIRVPRVLNMSWSRLHDSSSSRHPWQQFWHIVCLRLYGYMEDLITYMTRVVHENPLSKHACSILMTTCLQQTWLMASSWLEWHKKTLRAYMTRVVLENPYEWYLIHLQQPFNIVLLYHGKLKMRQLLMADLTRQN